MKTILILAGLPKDVVDEVREVSSKRFVPNGELFFRPLLNDSYYGAYSDELLKCSYKKIVSYPENEQISIILGFVRLRETESFLNSFFPFALPFELEAFVADWSRGKNSRNQSMNNYIDYLSVRCRQAIRMSILVKKNVDVRNLSPLLLPKSNFKSAHLGRLLAAIFSELDVSANPEQFLKAEIERFLLHHPYRAPDGEAKRCLSDGRLHFRSPGNNRHGFLRNSDAANHLIQCLLNARSRLGAPYDHSFHYDCVPLRGSLASSYTNCHGVETPPKKSHVNIAPNDYII